MSSIENSGKPSQKDWEITPIEHQLPATIEGLHAFLLVGKEKLKAHKAKIAAIEKLDLAHSAKEAAKSDTQDLAEVLVDAEVKLGEMLARQPHRGGKSNRSSRGGTSNPLPPTITKKESHYSQQIAAAPEIVEEAKTEARKHGEIVTAAIIRKKIQKFKEDQLQKNRPEEIHIEGKYKTIVVDPPWPVKKILRDERPNQDVWDYPKMTLEEIASLKIKNLIHPDGSHIYLWTTHKFLPASFNILEKWGFKYQCLLTWRKNVGMTPFSWMYSTEHILFGKAGNLDLLVNGKRLDFDGKVREHSRKPQSFYDLVTKVSPGPRVDIFGREQHDGFTVIGNETSKF